MQQLLHTHETTTFQPKKGWSEEEVQLLREWRSEKIPLKIMAHRLGRTTTAVNKKILRSGLKLAPSFSQKRKAPSRSYYKEKERRDLTARWVHLKDLISWLRRDGHSVIPSPQNNLYWLDGSFLQAHQILLAANKARIEKGLPIFCVHNITEI